MTVSDSLDWVVVSNRATIELHAVKHVQDILTIGIAKHKCVRECAQQVPLTESNTTLAV